jgi:hypothetical protein
VKTRLQAFAFTWVNLCRYTAGFEATGMSDAYDDRIFALSSIVASVLIYNLPETVKEAGLGLGFRV